MDNQICILPNYKIVELQQQELDLKIKHSLERIREWYEYYEGNVYVSFSGGKDSTVLLDLVRSIYPEVPAVFVNTGLEYPEIVDFVKSTSNITIIRPKETFKKIVEKYGYPVVSKRHAYKLHTLQRPTERNFNSRRLYLTGEKQDGSYSKSALTVLPAKWHKLIDAPFFVSHKCCDKLKKDPNKLYQRETGRKPYIGTMASDSTGRFRSFMIAGCNSFTSGNERSAPIAFWTTEDIWEYIKTREIKYCSVYDNGVSHTGCMFCMFGVHLEGHPNRFEIMKKTHPKQYKYCMEKIRIAEILDFIGVKY